MIGSGLSSITLVTNSTFTDHHVVLLAINLTQPRQNRATTKTSLNIKKDSYNIEISPVFKNTECPTSTITKTHLPLS